jgi:membrane protein DedA with SNARE-associated domain
VNNPKNLQPLDYQTPTPTRRVSAARYIVAIIFGVIAVPILWFLIGEFIVVPLTSPEEAEPMTTILLVADAIVSVCIGIFIFRAITRDPKDIVA